MRDARWLRFGSCGSRASKLLVLVESVGPRLGEVTVSAGRSLTCTMYVSRHRLSRPLTVLHSREISHYRLSKPLTDL